VKPEGLMGSKIVISLVQFFVAEAIGKLLLLCGVAERRVSGGIGNKYDEMQYS
jgi:hypothetical protein